MRNLLTFSGIHLHLRIPLTNFAESTYIADSTYFLQNLLTVAESRTTSFVCSLRNLQQNKCADKFFVTGICTRNPLKCCLWKPLRFWNVFKDLSLESRNIKTQNCASIQCNVWPRNEFQSNFRLRIL